jgi:hypothetical protein
MRTNHDIEVNRERLFSWGYHDGAAAKLSGQLDGGTAPLDPTAPRAAAYVIGYLEGVVGVIDGSYDVNDSTKAWSRRRATIPVGELLLIDVPILGRRAA